jgi:hypothetical protein
MHCSTTSEKHKRETKTHLFTYCPHNDKIRQTTLQKIEKYCEIEKLDFPFSDTWHTWMGAFLKEDTPANMTKTHQTHLQNMLIKSACKMYQN